jgi:hypothetical protein
VRCLPLILAIAAAPQLARADDGAAPTADPRAALGFAPAGSATTTQIDCSDGHAVGCAGATDPFAQTSPYAITTYLSTDYLRALPAADGSYDQFATHVLGAANDGAGPSLGGSTGVENRWTIDGAPVDDLFSGAAQSHVPLIFLTGMAVTTGGFTARDRASTGGTIDGELIKGGEQTKIDAYAWITYETAPATFPAVPDTFSPRTGRVDFGPALTAAVVASGPLHRLGDWLGGRAWYAAGIAPKVAIDHFAFTAQTLVDANGDGIADGLPGVPVTRFVDSYKELSVPWLVPAMARAGLDRGIHHVDLTLYGQLQHSEFSEFDATEPASGVNQLDFVGDAIASYRAEWPDTHVHVQASLHDNIHRDSAATSSAANIPQLETAYVPATLADDPKLAGACAAARTAIFEPCPVPFGFFDSGGAGELTDVDAHRATWSADVTHKLGDMNMLRAGATQEDTIFHQTERFTGDEVLLSLFPGETITERFLNTAFACDANDPATPCHYADSAKLDWHVRYSAAYVEDTVTLAPGLVADAGLRYEYMEVADAFALDEPAPRLGVSWDILGNGTSRVWASMGRSYPLIPAGIGSVVLPRVATVLDQTSQLGLSRSIDDGAGLPIASGLVAPKQDEATAGAQVSLLDHRIDATAWVLRRSLHDGLETTFGTFDNPGRTSAVVPPAERQTEQLGIELQTPPARPFAVRIGWSWGETVGTWSGPYDPRQGVVLYGGTDYSSSVENLYGVLPSSPGNRFYAEAIARFHVAKVPAGVSSRLTLQSGLPREALGDSDIGIVELLPRGAAGNDPMLSEVDVRLFANLHGFDVQLEVFDVFDQRDASLTDEIYAGNGQIVRPIDGGTYSDLIWLHENGGGLAQRNPAYGFPSAFQNPTTFVLGVHRAF